MEINPKSKSSIERIVDETGNKLNEPQDVANTFNQCFCNIGPELVKTITPPTSASSNFSHNCTSTFVLVDTSVEEVICGIDYLKIVKALKVDDIPNKFLKMAKTVLAPFLSVVFNKCMVKGVYPNSLNPSIGARFFGYNSPAAIARELFKPSTHAASFLGCIKNITSLIWVRGSPGRGSQIFFVFFDQI